MEYFENFISYRREDTEDVAEKLYELLLAQGYSVFWDQEKLKIGNFSKDIENAIKHCKNFILVVNKKALERCADENDWIRKEILLAIAERKNIVPLFVKENFLFPETFPEELFSLKSINGIPYFDIENRMHIEKLLHSFLKYNHTVSQIQDFEIENNILKKYKGNAPYVEIPENVEIIDKGAFADATFIMDVKIPSNVLEIRESAFERCRNIEVVELPDNLKVIGEKAFRRCVKLKIIKLNDNLEYIKDAAFEYCSELKKIVIPVSVKEIKCDAFNNCCLLAEIEVDANNVFYKSRNGILYDYEMKKVLRCPEDKNEVEIPDSVVGIGKFCFYKCNIKELKINGIVETIESYGFQQATIKNVVYDGAMPFETGEFAFVGSKFDNDNPFQIKRENKSKSIRKIKQNLLLYEYVTATTTFESSVEAHNMVSMLLDNKLIVAGQIREIISIYSWNNEICEEKEYELVCITEGRLYDDVENFIKANHSYEVCQIYCTPIINTSIEWGNWISDYVRNTEESDE